MTVSQEWWNTERDDIYIASCKLDDFCDLDAFRFLYHERGSFQI
jgi:hypothetical protein